jgi:uncharacterized protein YceK
MRNIVAITAGAALMTGCASMSTTTGTYEVDTAYVNYVEQAAKRFGTQVIWVNYPTKRTDAPATQEPGKQ